MREKFNFQKIAEDCLDKYWGRRKVFGLGNIREWDSGSPAHKFALKWVKKNIRKFNKMSWEEIYKEYLINLRQE